MDFFDRPVDTFEVSKITEARASSNCEMAFNPAIENSSLLFFLIGKGSIKADNAVHPGGHLSSGDLIICSSKIAETILINQTMLSEIEIIYGKVPIQDKPRFQVLESLPDPFILSPVIKAANPVIDDILRLLMLYLVQDNQKSLATLSRLFEILLLELVVAVEMEDHVGVIVRQAMEDQKIARAISLIHTDLYKDWTLETLASKVEMKPEGFLRRFKEIVLSDPATYMTRWRLQRSLELLNTAQLTIGQIAEVSGFDSESDFNDAFATLFGLTPVQYREKRLH